MAADSRRGFGFSCLLLLNVLRVTVAGFRFLVSTPLHVNLLFSIRFLELIDGIL